MFRTIRRSTLVGTVFALVAVAPVAAASTASAQDGGSGKPGVLATLKVTAEKVEVKKQGADAFKVARDGAKLREGDTVRTDATGLAEIDYFGDGGSYTRLDVDTTFTITELTDEQGSRHVQGSLDAGQAWHRTEALTESGSFGQEGAGANATTRGTAFNMLCESADRCLTTGVVHDVELTGIDGEQQVLDPFQQCASDDTQGGGPGELTGDLCAQVTQLTLDEIVANQWIQDNLLKDLLEHGYGPGPFTLTGTIVVEQGHVVSFTLDPPDTPNAPSAPAAPVIGPPPLLVDDLGPTPVSLDDGFVGAEQLSTTCDFYSGCSSFVLFKINVTEPADLSNVFVVFTKLPDLAGDVLAGCEGSCGPPVTLGTRYLATTIFGFAPFDPWEESIESIDEASPQVDGPALEDTMSFRAESDAASSPETTVDVVVEGVVDPCSLESGDVSTYC